MAAPRIVCDAPKYDFGTVIGKDQITHEFILTNIGDEPVRISNIKNCCGTKSTVEPMEIFPGSNAVCQTIFTTKNRYGPQEKQILIASNDRKNPYFELKITGTLKKAIEVLPRYIRLGKLSVGGEIDQIITATNLLEEPVVLESVQSTVPGIVGEIIDHVDPDPGSWTIKLVSNDKLQAGKFSGQIRLNFSTGAVSVPILGTVTLPIKVIPEQIKLSLSTADKAVKRLVMLKSEAPFEVISAELDDGKGEVQINRVSDKKWTVELKLNPSDFTASCLHVTTTCSEQAEVLVPIL
ncbi:DUF1573 domain-containing protein [Pontiellaceae bacterium B12219]|nr:DUF1573 domain-containing protein [Pontiellaceae bacterium B12219]